MMKYIFRSVNLIILIVILQALYFLALVYTLANLSPLTHFILTMFGVLCVFFIISGRDAAVYRLNWSVWILLFPAVMGVVYFFYNRRITGRKIEADMLSARKNSLAFLNDNTRLYPSGANNERLACYIEKTTGTPPSAYMEAAYFSVGEEFFKSFKEELNKAQSYIFIEFFLIAQSKMWNEILTILMRKRNEGVKVRIIFDGFGTLYTLPRGYEKELREAGLECVIYNPVRRLISFRLNTRNHRKLAVIDGVTAFCGGLNLADNYINAKPDNNTGHWKDSAVMVKGGTAWNVTLSFLAMWEFLTRKSEDYTEYIPSESLMEKKPHTDAASVWHDLPLDCESVSERILLNFITRADYYVYITTPYLSPGEEIISALCAAARGGTDVRLMLPFIPDKVIPSAISKSNYLPLLEAGVKIFEYPPGFIHSKNIVADDSRAAVSTVNLDYRALYMHHECGICFYGKKIIADIKHDFILTQKTSREITLEAYRKTGVFKRGLRRACRIIAPFV
ncbi:MAG: phospholipase D-like domain-containing protein [Oscillospiraceae bacterium]|nr:phospholipase D-like domain-containing protein [Oscillospiraceae bacterium]